LKQRQIYSQACRRGRTAYTYTGREWDKETGLYYNRARYYDPMEGRFISKDPISFAGGDANLYGYTGNNPVNRVDPEGENWLTDLFGKSKTAKGLYDKAMCGYYSFTCTTKALACNKSNQDKSDKACANNTEDETNIATSSKNWNDCKQNIPECQQAIDCATKSALPPNPWW